MISLERDKRGIESEQYKQGGMNRQVNIEGAVRSACSMGMDWTDE